MSLRDLLSVAGKPRSRYGPSPVFLPCDVARALFEIGTRAPLGRQDLTRILGVGEGSVRTILARLDSGGFLSTHQSGASLSTKGTAAFVSLCESFPSILRLPALDACFGKPSSALLCKGKAEKAGSGLSLRDDAIRAGADGLTVLVRVKGAWRFPNDNARARKADEALLDSKVTRAMDGDALLLGIGLNEPAAWRGAWTAGLALVR